MSAPEGTRRARLRSVVPIRGVVAALLTGLLTLAGTLALYQALRQAQANEVSSALEAEVGSARARLREHIQERVMALRRMAARFSLHTPAEAEWRADAESLYRDYGALQAIQRVDSAYLAQWVAPVKGNERAIGMDLSAEPRRRAALDEAKATGRTTFTPTVDLVQGGRGFLVAAPIVAAQSHELNGFIVGVFHVGRTVASVRSDDSRAFGYRVTDPSGVVFEQGMERADTAFAPVRGDLGWPEFGWTLEVFATDALVRSRAPNLPRTVLLAGISIAVLGALSALLREISSKRSRMLSEALTVQQAIFDKASYGIVTADPDGLVRTFNGGAAAMTGFAPSEVVGQRSLLDFLPPEERKEGSPREVIAELARADRELVLSRKDGSRFNVLWSVTRVVDDGGQDQSLLLIAQDITERRRVQAALEQAKLAAERAAEAKEEFLARMSHEIRTPLNGVLGMLELALRTPLSAEQREYVETSRTSARSLLDVINDILDFSKLGVRKLRLEPRPFALRDGLAEILRGFIVRANERGLDLMFSVDPSVPDALVGDLARIRQIVVNLVGNALKFTERGEILVTVTPEAAAARAAPDAIALHFCVADTGIGIPPEHQRAIFDAFTQADDSISRRFGGTGLGLAISAELVALMGGRIWVESTEGEGSKFHFVVTLQRGEDAPHTAGDGLDGVVVLVVEDGLQQRRLIENLLLGWRMAPGGAVRPGEALEWLSTHPQAALLICDAELPAHGAEELAAALRQEPALGAMRVLWVTGQAVLSPALEIPGRSGRVSKPVAPSALLEAIQALLTGTVPARRNGQRAPVASNEVEKLPSLHVLVADDNAVNRTVVTRLLEKEGHRVTAVEDGAQAIQAVNHLTFDACLMDVQMPIVDGLAATLTIRAAELGTSRHLPIIALTAQVMKDDTERCLAAGMDAYVPKPIEPEVLFTTLRSVIRDLRGPVVAAPAVEAAVPAATVDEVKLRTLTANSPELLKEIVGIFLEDLPEMLAAIEASLTNAEALIASAHRLKGSLLNVGCDAAAAHALELEMLGRSGEVSHAAEPWESLRTAVNAATPELKRIAGL